MIWMWIAVIVVSVICEAATAALVSIWFLPAALISLVLSFFEVQVWVQTVAFFAVSIMSIIAFHSVFKKHISRSKKTATNVDIIIGEKAVVTERIDNISAVGAVKVKGQYWSAKSTNDDVSFDVGEIVEVVSVSGVKLVCRKI